MTNPSGGSDENDRTTALVDDGKAKRGTYASALSSTLKTIVGTGVIALPYAMLEAGWLFGTIILLIVAYLSAYSMKVLIHCSHEVRFRYGSRVIRDEEIGEDEKEDDGDGSIRRIAKYTYGSWGVVVSDIILVTSQVGSAIAFAEFIITSWSDVLGVHVIWPAIVVAPILIFLSLLKSTASLDHCTFVIFVVVILPLAYTLLLVDSRNDREFNISRVVHLPVRIWIRYNKGYVSTHGNHEQALERSQFCVGSVPFCSRCAERVYEHRKISS